MKKRHLIFVPLLMLLLLTASACGTGGTAAPSISKPTVTITEPPAPVAEIRPTSSPLAPTGTPDATAAPSQATHQAPSWAPNQTLTITILYDNTAYDARLRADWGFAALIEYSDYTVLFDTGGDGAILMDNMAQLDIDSQAIDIIVLSHIHGDHTNGLQRVLDTGITPTVYVPASFPASFKRRVLSYTELVEINDPAEIVPGLHSTGELGTSIVEQALVIETGSGIVVITGCAHPGIVSIVQQARALVEGEVAMVLGGFHLLDYRPEQVEHVVVELRELGVRQVCPTHCTGEEAIAIFAEVYAEGTNDGYVQGGAGRIINIAAADEADVPHVPGLSNEEIATLNSLEQVDDYPLYTMRYYGAYDQDTVWIEREAGWASANQPTPWACSLFAALGDADNRVYGRNFDWHYSPAVFLFTDPPDGYASVSMVDIAYLGFDGDRATALNDLPLVNRQSLLRAPFWPFDGMNARGLVVGMAAVPPGDMPPDPAKETVDSLGIIREVLDHASDVGEAVAIMKRYNVDMGDGPPLHYLLADRSGQATLVEYYQGEMVIIPGEDASENAHGTTWHLATNFLVSSVPGNAAGECWRYDTLRQQLAEAQGRFTTLEAMDLLAAVSQDVTQWSLVYGISTGDVHVVMGGAYETVHVIPTIP